MGLSPKARRALPAFPNTVQFAMWDVFTVRKPFRFRAALPYLEHFAGGQERFSSLTEDLEAAHLIRRDDKICTHVFSTTPEIRLVLQQLLDCPPERKLRKLYLEGKVLELLSLFCDEAIGKQKNDQRYFQRRLPMLDESEGNYRQSFPPSFDNRTDCRTMFFERNQIETGVQNLF